MDFDLIGDHPSIWIGTSLLMAAYLVACAAKKRRPSRRQAAWFATALGVILIAHGELDELADRRLFVMHMLQHLVQSFVIPPLLLLGTPDWMLRPLVRPILPLVRTLTNPVLAFLLFTLLFVTAHFPPVFDHMCRDENFHIALHLMFMGTGVLLWWPLLSPLPELPRLAYPMQILYLFLLMIPMTAVAAPITLASHVIYPWYLEGPHAWGLGAMEDQIFGGLLMWIGQGTYLMFVFTAIFYRWASHDDRDSPELAQTFALRAARAPR
ncbi:MAG TPA: cytochrome c oxidase assembly protein [Candidatus Binataceae bacterium]|nr:cytochrome c oxidase assembly protein [Candidatus Binataceae bacterium]